MLVCAAPPSSARCPAALPPPAGVPWGFLPSAPSPGARLSSGLLGVSAVLDLTHSVFRASLLPSLLQAGPTVGAVPREGGAVFIREQREVVRGA